MDENVTIKSYHIVAGRTQLDLMHPFNLRRRFRVHETETVMRGAPETRSSVAVLNTFSR
jgi:hypothetical protein